MSSRFLEAMEGLKGYVQRSDTQNMPQLLDQVSDARENEASRHFAISLYAELAQMHKQTIIPYIPRMMASIVRSLPFSADTQQLHQACAKAVASLARYTIDPTRPYDSNQQILFNLCSPLLPVLASKLESSAAGAAICLQALVESEKWKYAHPDLQGLICSKATAAFEERGVHTVAFLHLIKSLAKFSRDASHWHVAEWVRIGLQVLQEDMGFPGSWQQRVAAAQLIAFILKTADVDKLGLDLRATTKILEAYLTDKVTVVQIAVAEALETVKGAALEKRVHRESSCESKRRNSDTEESGLSGSISPRSGTSSHEAVPSMASSTVKFGKRSNQRSRDSSCLGSHASLSLSMPSKLKENTPATIPRRVLSEIPASGKLLSNWEVLPSSCPSKPLRRSSVDLGSKVGSYLMQDKVSFGSGKSIQYVHNQIHDCAMKTSSPVGKHVEGCQNFSNMGCTCTLDKEEDGSNNRLASTDHLSGKADSEILEEHDEEGVHRLPINSICRRGCVNNDCAAGDKVSFASGKSIQCVDNQIHDCARKTSSPVRKHVEGCQNFSNMGCTCTLGKEEDGSNNRLANTDHLSGKADSKILEEHDDCVEEGMHRLPINSICRRGCPNDDCAAGVLHSGCTGDVVSEKDNSKGAAIESLTAPDLKVEKPHVLREEFAFRAPGSLLHSLQSSSSTKRRGKGCKKCTNSDLHLPNGASWMGSDVLASGESDESQVVVTDSESREETSGASCCSTSEDFNLSGDRTFKTGSRIHRQSLQKINHLDGKRLSVELNDCEIHASGQDWLSSRDSSDSGIGNDEKVENRQSGNRHRSFNKSGPRKHLTAQMEGNKLSAGPDCKSRGTDHLGKGSVLSEVFTKQICVGSVLGFACAVGVLVLAVMVIRHVNQIYDSHALVPT